MKPVPSAKPILVTVGVGVVLFLSFFSVTRPWGLSEADGGQSRVELERASEMPKPHIRSSYSPEAPGDDVKARQYYELMRLRDPRTGRIPADVRRRELAFAAKLPTAGDGFGKSAVANMESWTPRGPANVGGRTRALAIDLDFDGGSNQRLLAGGISGGMHISTNDGQSWSLATGLDDHASVTAIAQDPASRNVWYYGTGESLGNSASGIVSGFNGIGMFKSTDSGASWSHLASTGQGSLQDFDNPFDRVWSIDIHPTDGTVYAAVYGQILRSTDGGTSWTVVIGAGPPYSSMTDVHVAADGDVYAALSRNGSGKTEYGIFRSSTGAAGSFTNISPPGLVPDPYRIVLTSAPSDPSTVYVLVQSTSEGSKASEHQLFRYSDSGGTWQDLSSALPDEAGTEGNASMSTQGGYDQIVVVHPTNANIVFIGGTNLYRSDNGGQSFTRVGGYAGPDSYAAREGHHSDQHALVFYPNNSSIALSGNDGGVSRTTNILASPPTWAFINTGYVTSQFYGVGVDPVAGSPFIVGGLQDNGTWGIDNASGSASWFQLFSGDGGYANVSPGAAILTVTSQLGVMYRVTTANYSNIAPAGASDYQFIVPNALDPNDGNVLYLAEAGGVWRNSNLTGIPEGNENPTSLNWTFLSGSAQAGHKSTMLAVAKAPAGRIFFGTTDYQSTTRLIRVDNAQGNGSGVDIMPPIQTQGIPAFPSDVASNPNDGNEIVAVFSNYGIESIWHSTNSGGSWTNIGGNLGGVDGPSIRSATIVPTNSGKVVLVGTSTGVYSTSALNGGSTTWALEGGSVIGNVVVNQLVQRYSDATVTVATHGRGVYQATVAGGGSSGAQAATDKTSLGIEVLTPSNAGSTSFTLTNNGGANLTYSIGATGDANGGPQLTSNSDDPIKLWIDEADPAVEPWVRTLRERRQGSMTSTSSRDAKTRALEGATPSRLSERANAQSGATDSRASSSGDFLVNDDGDDTADQYVGFGDGFTAFQWYNRFVAPTGGFTLESVFINMRTEQVGTTSLFLIITDPQGNEITSGTVSLQASPDGTWYELGFTPVQLNAGQIFDVEFVADASIGFPAGADFDGLVTGSSYFFDGFSYTALSTQPNFANGAFLIRPQGSLAQTQNNPPIANIQVSKSTADVNESITFNGTGSSDSDGTITQYAWNFGDGESASSSTANHAYSAAGNYTVTLTVTDDKGATNQASTGLSIVSSQPSRLSVAPQSGTLTPGQSVTVTVTYDATSLGLGVYSGNVTVTTNGGNLTLPVTIGVTSVGTDEANNQVADFAIRPNYPNPFSSSTTIPYTLARSGLIRIVVHDIGGRVVRRLVDAQRLAGEGEVTWDGRDDAGRMVASGIYLVRLEASSLDGQPGSVNTRKITLRK